MSNKHTFNNSSSIASCDYDDDTKTLEICFVSGATHTYANCPKSAYESLKDAASPGKHFHLNIRSNYASKKK